MSKSFFKVSSLEAERNRVRVDRSLIGKLTAGLRHRTRVYFLTLLSGLMAAGCATGSPTSYMGIDLASPVQSESVEGYSERVALQSLAQRAQAGDKHAQLELGIRFEEGRGVERDLNRAKKLYRSAALDDLADVEFYQPAIGGIPAQNLRMKGGSLGNGLAEAKRRLCLLSEISSHGLIGTNCEKRGGE